MPRRGNNTYRASQQPCAYACTQCACDGACRRQRLVSAYPEAARCALSSLPCFSPISLPTISSSSSPGALRPIVHVVFLSSPLDLSSLPASLFFPLLPSLFPSVETTVECTTTLPRPSLLSSARALPLSSPSLSLPSSAPSAPSASHVDRGAAPRVIATRRTFQ